MQSTQNPTIPLSLYIHIPWCERKCPYCDFNSHDNQQHFDEKRYINALVDDLRHDVQMFNEQRHIQSIFIGGGTPSLFSGKAYQILLSEIAKQLDITTTEITLEANPSSSERKKFAAYRDAGINRLSIGVQSFDETLLKRIGRVHGRQDALNAANAAHTAGFDNVNLDIMFALPEQSLTQALDDIETAIAQSPTHISCYQLTLEPNTLFHKQPPKLPNSELAWDMQTHIQQRLKNAGLIQYEVSAYAHTTQQCQHNLNYWQFGDYLGIGAGAHGKITQTNGNVVRYWKHKQPKHYLNTAASKDRLGNYNTISSKELPFEFMLNTLRLKQGFSKELFEQRTSLTFATIEKQLTQHIQQGLMKSHDSHFSPTATGFRFIDSMLNDYL